MLGKNAGKPVEPLDDVEIDLTGDAAQEFWHRDVAGAHQGVKLDQPALGLDHEPAPPLEVEPARDIVGDRVPGPDIDIEPARLAFEGAGEVVILEIGGVGQVHGRHAELGYFGRNHSRQTALPSRLPSASWDFRSSQD